MPINIGKCVKMPDGSIFCYNEETGEMYRVEITRLIPEDMKPADVYRLLSEIMKE